MSVPWPLPAWFLPAQAEVGRSVEAWWRRPGSLGVIALLLVVVLAVAVVWAGLFLWERWRRHSGEGGMAGAKDASLFDRLCRAHGLSGDEVQLLRDLARQQAVDPPAVLFIDPRPLEYSLDRDATAALRRKLFGDVECAAGGG